MARLGPNRCVINETYDTDKEDDPLAPSEETPLLVHGKAESAGNNAQCTAIPCRYTITLLCFLGIFCSMNCRMCFNMALVAMVNYTEVDVNNTVLSNDSCPSPESDNHTETKKWTGHQFDWSDNIQSLMLAAHYYGYVITQVPGGYLAERIGGKAVLGFSVFCPSVLCLLIPTLAYWDWRAVVAVRILLGLTQGPLCAANSAIIGRWAPRLENSRMYNLSMSGFNIATMVSFVLTGFLCGQQFLGGWPAAFYLFGSLGLLWMIPWYFLGYSSPDVHPRISPQEKQFILKTAHSRQKNHQEIPWLAIFTSKAVIGFFLFALLDSTASYLITTSLPYYLKLLLHYDMSVDGLFSALPQLCCAIGQVVGGSVADCMRKYISTRRTRKILTFIGSGTTIATYMLMTLVECDHIVPVVLITGGSFITAIGWSGAAMNHLDIAPMYAGIFSGISNGLGNIGGFVAPAVLSAVTHMQNSRSRWKLFYYITSAFSLCGLVAFLILGEAEVQPWARPTQTVEITVNVPSEDDSDTGLETHSIPIDDESDTSPKRS